MDPRSLSVRLDNPAGALDRLSERSGVAFPALSAAAVRTAEGLPVVARRIASLEPPRGTSVVLFGSWARAEVTERSDDDWAIVVTSETIADATADELRGRVARELGQGDAKPGATEIFESFFRASALTDHTGLEEDSNKNLTRRMLMLLESVPVSGAGEHAACWDAVLHCYLARQSKDRRPPRFLLNDLVRYWRTMCVDFEGKSLRSPDDRKWVTRNAKLRVSRKVLFAAGLIPVLCCSGVPLVEQQQFLSEQLRARPVDRLAQAFMQLDGGKSIDAGVRALTAYDEFVGLLAQSSVREELLSLTATTRDSSATWASIHSIAEQLQSSLLSLMFGPDLAALTQEYGIF